METLKNIVKGTIVLGIVGFLLALAAEPLASAIGANILGDAGMAAAANASATALWSGVFFGTFGALNAAVGPVMDWVLGKDEVAATPAKEVCCGGHARDVNAPSMELQPDAKANLYTQMIDAQRAQNAGQVALSK